MNKYLLIFILSQILYFNVNGKSDKKYICENISEELMENANAVIRNDEMVLTIVSVNEINADVKFAVTILNNNARDYGQYKIYYDNDTKICNFKGSLYDAEGNLVKKLKGSEIKDESAFGSYALFSDNRMKVASLSHNKYPYTVEFEYTKIKKNVYNYPSWSFQSGEKRSVENSYLKVIVPEDLDIRYKEYNLANKVKRSIIDNNVVYEWQETNLPAFESEPYSPPLEELIPWIAFAPYRIEYNNYKGDYSTWKSLGDWQNYLNRDRDELSADTRQIIKELVADTRSDIEKVRRIYEYLQSKTRYVSIQLGIGGNQPFPATVVDEYGYGDCKALSNYAMALLKAAGVNSYYSIISAGDNANEVDKDFPSDQFNHVILCVPMETDTIWLECTSQTNPFGYLGKFTGNRYALVVTNEGGKLIKTAGYYLKDNTQIRTANVTLKSNGNGEAEVITKYKGIQYENDDLNFIINLSYEDQKKWLYSKLDLPSFEIVDFSFSQDKGPMPEATEKTHLALKNYSSVSGKRLFFQPNLLNVLKYIPRTVDDRKTDVVKLYAFYDVDTIKIKIPARFKVEYLPGEANITSRFGSYHSSVEIADDIITYIRSLEMEKGRFPPSSYEELREFYKKIAKSDNLKVVLVEF